MSDRECSLRENLLQKKIRVLHSYKVYLPEIYGGVPTAIHSVTSGLLAKCISTILTTRRRWRAKKELYIDGSRVIRIYSFFELFSLPLAPFYPLRLFLEMKKHEVVVLHAPFPLSDIVAAFLVPKNVKLIVHYHSEIIKQKLLLPFVAYFIKRTLERADKIIVSSEPFIENSNFLLPHRHKTTIVPFGTDVEYWSSLSPEEKERVADLKAQHPNQVITVARLVSYKGLDILISALRNVEANCIIVGEGILGNVLRKEISERNLESRVSIVSNLERDELKILLHASSVFVLPSVTVAETFGLAQLEAMATGLPIINTNLPTGVPWVARDGLEGITVPPNQIEPLSRAISLLLADDELRTRLSAAAQQRARSTFSDKVFFEKYFEIISSSSNNE